MRLGRRHHEAARALRDRALIAPSELVALERLRPVNPVRDLVASIPAKVNYRESTDPLVECATCSYYDTGHCTMFDADVSPGYVCDEWAKIVADHATNPTPATRVNIHNAAVRKADKASVEQERALVADLIPILEKAGEDAARAFTATASRSVVASAAVRLAASHGPERARELLAGLELTAASPGPNTTMIAVKPRPEEAAALALPDGEPAEFLHVTLAVIGGYDGPLEDLAALLRPVGASHAGLDGAVGGVGAFGDNGNGPPIILLPSVPGLVELRVAITDALVSGDVDYARNHGYLPHVTVDYADDPERDYSGLSDDVGAPLHFDSIWVVRGDTETVEIPLVGPPPITASAALEYFRERLVLAPMLRHEPVGDEDDLFMRDLVEAMSKPFVLRGELGELRFVPITLAADADVVARIRETAYAHRPDGGYGDTAWNAETRTVFWCAADWSESDEIEAAETAFLAISGVDHFESDAEVGMEPYSRDGWEVVWRERDGEPTAALVAAPVDPPDWQPPFPNQVVDVDELAKRLRGKTDPVRQGAVESVMTDTLEGVGISFDVTNPLTAKVLAQSGSQVTEIAKTTQLNVMRSISVAYEQGLSIPSTAALIRAGMAEAAPWRATLIARTELAGAVNGGSLAAVQIVEKATGDTYLKVWMTAPGAIYPRHEDYDDLDGQSVPLAGKFSVGADSLDHPGDPAGSPEEVCNCRCAMSYETPGGEETDADVEE